MKKSALSLLSLVLALLLTGCGLSEDAARDVVRRLRYGSLPVYSYARMTYTRPDLDAVADQLEKSCAAAAGDQVEAVMEEVYAFFQLYDDYQTNTNLAMLRYHHDLSDAHWEEEYTFCNENAATLSASAEQLYRALAKSPCRAELDQEQYFGPGFLDAYESESVWDETFVALSEQEAQLQNRYYDLSAGEDTQAMAELLAQLVQMRREQAAQVGYDSYVNLAYDLYYERDYTPAQIDDYFADIAAVLTPTYRELLSSPVWQLGLTPCSAAEALDFVRDCAGTMGGAVEESFYVLEKGGLYDITYSARKYDASYEIYLGSYGEPFLFVNPEGLLYDKLRLSHEFGHFANDYLCGGSVSSIDVAEIMSQGMEYLSLFYGSGTADLEKLKLADTLCTFVEQAAYGAFEQALYELPEEELTVAGITDLYTRTAAAYGLETEPQDFTYITHLYTNPMYIVSYVVSCDAALQLYEQERASSGAGLAKYEEILTTEETSLMAFLSSAELESPFAEGRLETVRALADTVLS